MQKHERALQELQHYAYSYGGGMQILYDGSTWPTIKEIDGVKVPLRWLCGIRVEHIADGRRRVEQYTVRAVTMEDAILECHKRCQGRQMDEDKHLVNASIKDRWERTPDK